jgi:poly-beta-1,6-N-acetyl-D-glucosamine N-deacetylase
LSRSRVPFPVAACLPVALALGLSVAAGCDKLGVGGATASPSATPVAVASGPTPPPTPTPFNKNVYAPLSPKAQASRVPVIMYHDVTPERGKGSVYFDCTKAEFAEQIAWLEEQGASFVSLEQLHNHLTTGEPLPPKSVVLTFDDNYQGFYDNAYPLIKEKQIPVAMFVHTNFVGDQKGARSKMSWDTLRELDKDGLVTIGSHTLSHPEDISQVPAEEQDRELIESKALLEKELGHPIPYFAYPNGKWDENVADAAMRAGYTMAFTIHNGPAQESPGILSINRYIHTRLKDAWKESEEATVNAPAAYVDVKISDNPVILQVEEFDGIKLGIVRGGKPATWRAIEGRRSVGEFIKEAQESGLLTGTVVGGMNGTFFADAALRGTDNMMIGPCMTRSEGVFYPDEAAYRLPKLRNRPLVLFSDSRLMIVPFAPEAMNKEATVKEMFPEATDVFLAGAWIVHDGVARTKEEMAAFSARDFNDPRRRAFFGVTDSGDVVLGGSLEVITTEALAKAAAAAGVKEAVLMDSGFSTSIVYDNKIIVTGHTAKNLPSRAVPHSIVVTGTTEPPTDPEVVKALEEAKPAVGDVSAMEAQEQASQGGRRRRRR